ncbi:uncharacterized protein LOC6556581 [Drosophila grimshawi]|nr:uncharacterized protein LOC6556581 [Drosophila grimshawi]
MELLLCLSCCLLWLVQGAQVYMEFNGVKYSYNTDRTVQQTNDLSPNYELQSHDWLGSSTSRNRDSFIDQWGWTHPEPRPVTEAPPPPPPQQPLIIDFSTQHMSHTQHSDDSGIVLGKYSYYDAAGYHELSYKAGDGIGFVVMGGNLVRPTTEQSEQSEQSIQY